MNEDLAALTAVMNQFERLTEKTENINSSDNIMPFVELGKHISNLEHEIEKLKNENAILKEALKDHYGWNT